MRNAPSERKGILRNHFQPRRARCEPNATSRLPWLRWPALSWPRCSSSPVNKPSNQLQRLSPRLPAPSKFSWSSKVRGPSWMTPKTPTTLVPRAPKTKLHRDLYVAASNDSVLAADTYHLSVPAHAAAFSGALDPSFAQAKIDAKSLQHALDDKSGRYVIRLPKPEAYVAAKRFRSRVGATYVPEATTEQNYATQVSFRYTVSTLNGFSLAGTPDTGTFNPLLLQLETPAIRFAIEPAVPESPTDMCHTHSREAFRDTVKFLG